MVYRRRKPARSLIFHSDRGVQYAAARAYRERLEAYGIRQSMSRRGDPYDNAVAENFFSCSSVSWSTSSTILQGQPHRTMSLPISKPFTTPSAPILPLAGVHLQVLKPNLLLPPPDRSTLYLCIFIQLFPPVLCPFFWGRTHKCWVLKQALGPYSNKTSRPVFRGGSFCAHSVKEKREEKNQRFVWTCRIFASRSRACSRGG